ncbi:hypothetical protein [Hydrotalea sp.]|nr:hypothetical protein [Hydrotalea sp.]
MHPRKKIGFFTVLIIGVALGFLIKNVKIGMVLGLALGLFASSMLNSK